MYIFNLNVVFTLNFLEMALSYLCFSPGFPLGEGFPGEEFAPACFKNSGGAPPRSTFSAEAVKVELGVLEPCWSNLLHKNRFFPHMVSCNEIAPQKIPLKGHCHEIFDGLLSSIDYS
jgi:hypothetical protein